jgi:DNA-binding CsgD family transcriptional regulator/PAS domain-containing protein
MAAERVDPHDLFLFQSHYAAINPWMAPQVHHLHRPGVVVYGEEIVPQEEFTRSAFYHEFGKRSGIVFALGTTVAVEGEVHALISTNRGEDRGTFRPEEHSVLERVAPHVAKVLTWQSRLSGYRRLQELFDQASEAIWEIDTAGRIHHRNVAGQRAMDREAMVRSRAGRLEMRQAEGWRSVRGAIREDEVVRTTLWTGTTAPVAALTCYPLALRGPGSERRFGVVLHSLEPPAVEALQAAGKLLGLTRAEARLVAKLFAIPNMVEAAAALGVSPHTAKSQLGAAMRKAGAGSKVELMLQVRQTAQGM